MAEHNELGKKGELIARKFLEEKGIQIIETNWRHEKDEIDVIAKDGDELVMVEVKTRSTRYFGDPSEAVGNAKESFLIRAAEAYVEIHNLNIDIRFDIISIVIDKKGTHIEYIKDAFYPELPDLD
ncbi:MAG: YraN family protein [Bacteroidales bacterium]|jgi:putative endonuclease|nr:YraN family protein [Bacteroidales bacterium]